MDEDGKRCHGCGETLPPARFYKNRFHADGLSSACRDCTKRYNNERYHAVNKADAAYVERARQRGRDWYEAHRERAQTRHALAHRAEREACFVAYGGRCECCGEDRYEFLAIDHVNGGGEAHRKEVGGKMCRWLIKQGFPSGFRVLCHNCNSAFGYYGYCPHDRTANETRGLSAV